MVTVEVVLTDRRLDFLAENIDVAIRAGELKDSSLIAKRLGSAYFAPFASPKYLKAAGTPAQPKDLRDHQWVHFTPLGSSSVKLKSDRSTATVPLNGRIVINDLTMVKNLVVAGNGIALLPTFFCYPELNSGKLIRLLPEWHTELSPVHFVYPGQKHVSAKLTAFIDFATDELRASLNPR
jgi:DNA-binding transcriptional LysR family regulator